MKVEYKYMQVIRILMLAALAQIGNQECEFLGPLWSLTITFDLGKHMYLRLAEILSIIYTFVECWLETKHVEYHYEWRSNTWINV